MNPGYLVETKTGKRGRIFNSKELINGKMPVYLEINKFKFSATAILCEPKTLKIIGYID
jgi:hypothetical protein